MSRIHFMILILLVSVSGFSQGALLPVISIIFEHAGTSPTLNGLHATGLYLGVLIASPFMEAPLRRFGFKPLIVIGGIAVFSGLFGFVFFESYLVWFFLRLLIGVGDHMLHFSTQTWVTYASTSRNRGRNISLYGISFSLGFAAGPFLTPLIKISPSLPFIVTGAVSLCIWVLAFLLKNTYPDTGEVQTDHFNSLQRFKKAFQYGWVAFMMPFCYGFLETTLNSNFPVYALRSGVSVDAVALILPAFAIGSIVFQLPLGMLSDKFGRRRIILYVTLIGALLFLIAGLLIQSVLAVAICFFIAGMAVGSTFSLGISYMTDLLPIELLPAGNLMCGMAFSAGSILGPVLGGFFVQTFEKANLLYLVSLVILFVFCCVRFGKASAHVKISQ
ncbi:MFS transporter [Bacillus sp. NPDC077027]|uniref:MFS transporter n=1 Tax=Bacillus sp. NPDC077027 TaxID=3390548 RepID=UPI003D076BBA